MRMRRHLVRAATTAAVALATTTATGASQAAAPEAEAGACAAGQLCLWEGPGYRGGRAVYELSDISTESCGELSLRAGAGAFANRTGRPVTLYQGSHCDTTGEFATFPSGSWVPESTYRARSFTVWER